MSDVLEFCRPEEVGVSPSFVCDYINEVNRRGKMCHSFMMIRHGKVFAEGYWKPFHKDWKHRMYSISKTFVSAAIGMLVDEGRIKLTDKICDYFPDKLPENLDPLIAEMTLRDMLMMATCHPLSTYERYDPDWLATFFEPHHKPDRKAGTKFHYDTSASYTLDVLVERLTGKTFLDYVKDKGLCDMGFSKDSWCVKAPEGYAWGGSGVMCTTRDLARFASVFANEGEINGKRILSKEYVREATAKQIDNDEGKHDALKGHGYGYQIWRTANNTYSFCGMGGQLATIVPDKDFILVCTSDTQGDADGYAPFCDIVFDTVINRMSDEAIPYDEAAYSELKELTYGLTVNMPFGEKDSPEKEKINGVTYELDPNQMGIKSFEINFDGYAGSVCLHTDRGDKEFPFGCEAYVDTFFPEKHYYGDQIGVPADREFRCLNAGVWTDEKTFMLRTYIIDVCFGNMAAYFSFEGDGVKLKMIKAAEFFLDEYFGEAEGKRKE